MIKPADCHGNNRSELLYLINDQVQLLVAVLCADKYFGKSEFGLRVFEIGRSGQKPGEDRAANFIHECPVENGDVLS